MSSLENKSSDMKRIRDEQSPEEHEEPPNKMQKSSEKSVRRNLEREFSEIFGQFQTPYLSDFSFESNQVAEKKFPSPKHSPSKTLKSSKKYKLLLYEISKPEHNYFLRSRLFANDSNKLVEQLHSEIDTEPISDSD